MKNQMLCAKNQMAYFSVLTRRNHLQNLNFHSLLQIPLLKTYKFQIAPFSTTQNSQSFNLSNINQQIQHRKQISLANLLQRYGFSSSEIPNFIEKNKFLLNSNASELEQSLKILSFSVKLHQNYVVSLIYGCPSVLDLDFLKKWEVGISKLGLLVKFDRVIKSVLEFSRKFGVTPDRFCSCVEKFRGLGFSDGSIIRVLGEFPGVVMINGKEIENRIEFWKSIGVEKDGVEKICVGFPGVLGFQVESRLKPLMDEFKEMGFGRRIVREEIVKEPRVLSLELGELRRCLELLRRLRCRESIKEKIFCEGEFKAGFAVKVRVDCLCKYGLIRRDALNILRREPRSITFSVEDIEKKIEFLLDRMKLEVESLIEVPEYLGVNFDKQIVPRHNVIEYLRSKGGLGFEVGLRDIIKPSRLRFYNLYVKPYPECEHLYGRFTECVEKKALHPAGLWKIFKPAPCPKSEEDLKNLKSFMESLG